MRGLIEVSNDKRALILRVAVELFAEKGFADASIAEITARANVAKGTLYLYFSSKEDLIRQTFLYCHDMNVAACEAGLDQAEGAVAKLCRRMKNAVRWALEHPREARVDGLYLSTAGDPEFGTHYWQQKHFDRVDPVIRKGIEDGELKNLDPVLLGEVFFGIAGAYYQYVLKNPELLENERIWALCEQTVIDCLSR